MQLIAGPHELGRGEALLAAYPFGMVAFELAGNLTGIELRRTILHDDALQPGHERAQTIANRRHLAEILAPTNVNAESIMGTHQSVTSGRRRWTRASKPVADHEQDEQGLKCWLSESRKIAAQSSRVHLLGRYLDAGI